VRYLGLDYGDKTIGIAVSDPGGRIACGLTTLRRDAPEALRQSLRELKAIVREHDIHTLVLGLPKHMDNAPSQRSAATAAFGQKLTRMLKRPVVLWDERLSTQAVSRAFDGGPKTYTQKVDEMAAVYILQGFLDYTNKKNGGSVLMENEKNDEMFDDFDGETQETDITLTDEDGNETKYEILAAQKDEGVVYWLLAELSDDGDEAEVFQYKCVLSDDEEEEMTFELVDEEHSEFEKVLDLFKDDYKELGIEID
jgi:putative Holliday junction resolvase